MGKCKKTTISRLQFQKPTINSPQSRVVNIKYQLLLVLHHWYFYLPTALSLIFFEKNSKIIWLEILVLHPANVLHHTEINLEKKIKYSKTVKLLHFKRLLQCINYSSHLEIFWVYRENEGIKKICVMKWSLKIAEFTNMLRNTSKNTGINVGNTFRKYRKQHCYS